VTVAFEAAGPLGFYFITDSRLTANGIAEDVRRALEAGVVLVQYREKELARPERLAEAKELLRICRRAGVPLVINDDIRLAEESGADGVHLGQSDAPPAEARAALGGAAVVGVSAGSPAEAEAAEDAGATYVAASAVFATGTKPDAGPPIGPEGVRAIREATRLPLAAIGGIDATNVRQVVRAGADMVCAISASLRDGAVAENIRAIMRKAAE
jgi:thiamine-phosphate pyrophosphorylase